MNYRLSENTTFVFLTGGVVFDGLLMALAFGLNGLPRVPAAGFLLGVWFVLSLGWLNVLMYLTAPGIPPPGDDQLRLDYPPE